MQWVYENRACSVLYNILKSSDSRRKWLLPVNACSVIPKVFQLAEKKIEYIDIEKNGWCIDREEVFRRNRFNPEMYGGILFILTYGHEPDLEKFPLLLKKFNPELQFILDKCLCYPCFEENIPDGVDAVIYSTGYAKNVDLGFGGFGLLRDSLTYIRHRPSLLNGDNAWLNMDTPSISFEQYKHEILEKLPKVIEYKSKIIDVYDASLVSLRLTKSCDDWRYNIIVKNKNTVLEKMREHGLFASSHYSLLCTPNEIQNFPVADYLQNHVINLFNDFYCTEKMASETIKLILDSI